MHPAFITVENLELIFRIGQEQDLRSLAWAYQHWGSRLPHCSQVSGMRLVAKNFLQVPGFLVEIFEVPVGHASPRRWRRALVCPRKNTSFEGRSGGKVERR